MKLPWISRKQHNRQMEELRNEVNCEREQLVSLVQKLVSVRAGLDPTRYRVVVYFDFEAFQRALEDPSGMRYFAEALTQAIIRELI